MKTWFKTPLGALIDLQVYRGFRIVESKDKFVLLCYFYQNPADQNYDEVEFDAREEAYNSLEIIHSLLDPSHKSKKTKEAK